LGDRKGHEVGDLIANVVRTYAGPTNNDLRSIGVSIPGISHRETGTVWAPNIPGWDDYPLLNEIGSVAGGIPVTIDNDRACSILGESWLGNARNCKDAIFLAVGTGIGAGVLADGQILRGAHDIAGAIGWMALQKPFLMKYISYGCFEYYASGDGIARLTREMLASEQGYTGILRNQGTGQATALHVFAAYEDKDPVATKVIGLCVEYWGMAVANLISIFNPEKIIFGGGVFGPAIKFIPQIKDEALKWAQPISASQVTLVESALGGNAAIYGAGFLALHNPHLR
jgi:glucokinase